MKSVLILIAVITTASAVAVADESLQQSMRGHRSVALAEKDKDDHKEGEKDHDHDEDGEEHAGEKTDLGTQKIGGYDVQVTLIGKVKPGEEAIFIIKPKGEGEPKAVRAWVGIGSGKGSIRTKAEEEKEGEWHAHHKVSKPLPDKSMLWIELETAAGKQKVSFDVKL